MSDHYQLLGISREADPLEIKKAYKRLATQYHPDKVECLGPKLRDLAVDEMRRLNEARDILLDPKRRADYDMSLLNPNKVQTMAHHTRYNYKCPHCMNLVAAVPMDRPYVVNCPTCRGGMTIPSSNGNGTNPITQNSPKPPEKMNIYREAVRRALNDGVITNDEMSILDGLRVVLGINPMEHQQAILSVRSSMGG